MLEMLKFNILTKWHHDPSRVVTSTVTYIERLNILDGGDGILLIIGLTIPQDLVTDKHILYTTVQTSDQM